MYIMEMDLMLQDGEFSRRKYLPYKVRPFLSVSRIWEWMDIMMEE